MQLSRIDPDDLEPVFDQLMRAKCFDDGARQAQQLLLREQFISP